MAFKAPLRRKPESFSIDQDEFEASTSQRDRPAKHRVSPQQQEKLDKKAAAQERNPVDEEDDAPAAEVPWYDEPRKTKKPASTDLVVLDKKGEVMLTPATIGRFRGNADLIISQLEERNDDGAVSLLHRSLLQTLVDLMPVLEEMVRGSKGRYGVYPLNQLVQQIRETAIDLQSTRDKGQLGQRILDRTLRPAFSDLAAQIVQAFVLLEATARTMMTEKDFDLFREKVTETRTGIAEFMNTQYREVSDQVVQSLS